MIKMRNSNMKDSQAGSFSTEIQARGNITPSTDHSSSVQEDVSVRKRRASDDGELPSKRTRCSEVTNPAEHSDVSVQERGRGKRKASVDAEPPAKKTRSSISSTNGNDPSVTSEEDSSEKKRKASDDGEAPAKKMRCTDSTRNTVSSVTESSTGVSSATESSTRGEVKEDGSADDDSGNISQSFNSAITEEERIYELSSTAIGNRAHFTNKYCELGPIGAGGFGSVFAGYRKSDSLKVAIKRIPAAFVRCEEVTCNGRTFHIILEVALMLKAAGLSGSVGQSAAVSLLDWYILDQQLILVMERPDRSMDLHRYLQFRGGSLGEGEAKLILRQLVDAAIDMHSKGVFHQDIKLENVLVQLDSGVPRVRIIDFGCGSIAKETSYNHLRGTRSLFPPEWFDEQTYWARPTTVWQLGALFYSMLSGHERFHTLGYINHRIRINRALSTDVKILLYMCLTREPSFRATLEQLQRHRALRPFSTQ